MKRLFSQEELTRFVGIHILESFGLGLAVSTTSLRGGVVGAACPFFGASVLAGMKGGPGWGGGGGCSDKAQG